MIQCDAFATRPRDWDWALDSRLCPGVAKVNAYSSYVRLPSRGILSVTSLHEVIATADKLCSRQPQNLATAGRARDDIMLPFCTAKTAFVPAYRPASADFPVVLSDLTPLTATWRALSMQHLGVRCPEVSFPPLFRENCQTFFDPSFNLKECELRVHLRSKPMGVYKRTPKKLRPARKAALRAFWSDALVTPSDAGSFVLGATSLRLWHKVILDAFSAWLAPLTLSHQALITGRMISCGFLRVSTAPLPRSAMLGTFAASTAGFQGSFRSSDGVQSADHMDLHADSDGDAAITEKYTSDDEVYDFWAPLHDEDLRLAAEERMRVSAPRDSTITDAAIAEPPSAAATTHVSEDVSVAFTAHSAAAPAVEDTDALGPTQGMSETGEDAAGGQSHDDIYPKTGRTLQTTGTGEGVLLPRRSTGDKFAGDAGFSAGAQGALPPQRAQLLGMAGHSSSGDTFVGEAGLSAGAQVALQPRRDQFSGVAGQLQGAVGVLPASAGVAAGPGKGSSGVSGVLTGMDGVEPEPDLLEADVDGMSSEEFDVWMQRLQARNQRMEMELVHKREEQARIAAEKAKRTRIAQDLIKQNRRLQKGELSGTMTPAPRLEQEPESVEEAESTVFSVTMKGALAQTGMTLPPDLAFTHRDSVYSHYTFQNAVDDIPFDTKSYDAARMAWHACRQMVKNRNYGFQRFCFANLVHPDFYRTLGEFERLSVRQLVDSLRKARWSQGGSDGHQRRAKQEVDYGACAAGPSERHGSRKDSRDDSRDRVRHNSMDEHSDYQGEEQQRHGSRRKSKKSRRHDKERQVLTDSDGSSESEFSSEKIKFESGIVDNEVHPSSLAFKLADMQLREHSRAFRDSKVSAAAQVGAPPTTGLRSGPPQVLAPPVAPTASNPVSKTETLLEELLMHLRTTPPAPRCSAGDDVESRAPVHREDTRGAEARLPQRSHVEDIDARLSSPQQHAQHSTPSVAAPSVQPPVTASVPDHAVMYEPPQHPQLSQNPAFSASRFSISPRGPAMHAPLSALPRPLPETSVPDRPPASVAARPNRSPLRQEFSGQPLVSRPPAQPPLAPQRFSMLSGAASVAGDSDAQSQQGGPPEVPLQDDSALPLSSTGARERQEALDIAAAEAAEADLIRIQNKMDSMKPEQLDAVNRLPLGSDPDEFARFAASCRGVVAEILRKSDVKRKQSFDSPKWANGWLPLLRKRVRTAVVDAQTTNRATLEFLDATFLQVESHLRKDPSGPSTYTFFIRKLAAAWDSEDKTSGIDRLRSFGVPTDVTFGEYIRQFKALTLTVLVSHHAFKPSDSQVQIAVRDSMLKQFPVLSGQLYKEAQLTMEAPFGRHDSCLDDMWEALDKLTVAHTPAVNGAEFFSVSSTNIRSSSAVSRAVASSAMRPASTSVWSKGASSTVMTVDPQPVDDRDPFMLHYSDWPLQGHYEAVYQVALEYAKQKQDPQLFTPLLTPEARRDALRTFQGKCLNCLGEDHSFKLCSRGFVNATGLLNPDIKHHLESDPDLWTRWQKRMSSHRRAGRFTPRSNSSSRHRRDTSDKKRASNTEHSSASSESSTSNKRGGKGKN